MAAGMEQHESGSCSLRAGGAFCWTCRPNYPGMCVCGCQSLASPPALLCLELRAVGWDDPAGYNVSLNFAKINHVVYKSPRPIVCEDSLLKTMHCVEVKAFI